MTTQARTNRPAISRVVAGQAVGAVGWGSASVALRGVPAEDVAATVHAGLDAGIRLLDAAAAYTPDLAHSGHSERLLTDAVASWNGPRDEVLIATKGGHRRVADGLTLDAFVPDGRPTSLREDVDASLAALGTECIGLYFLHWPDPAVPVAESVGALAELQTVGKIAHIGLSNVTLEQLDEATEVATVAAVQNRFSPFAQESLPVVEWCEAHDAAFLAYSPLGGGRVAGSLGDQLPGLGDLADQLGVSPQRLVLAWLLQVSDRFLPIVGAGRVASIVDSALAMTLEMSQDDRLQLAALVDAANAGEDT